LYSYCMSYTGLITCSLMIILPLYFMKLRKEKFGIIEYGVGALALPLCLLYSIFAPYVIPENVISVGYAAFAYCDGLLTAEFPETEIEFGNSIFDFCGEELRIKAEPGSAAYNCMKNEGYLILGEETETETETEEESGNEEETLETYPWWW